MILSQSFSSIQQHLDEEAVSHLDDEGGSPDIAMDPPGAARKAGLGSEMFL